MTNSQPTTGEVEAAKNAFSMLVHLGGKGGVKDGINSESAAVLVSSARVLLATLEARTEHLHRILDEFSSLRAVLTAQSKEIEELRRDKERLDLQEKHEIAVDPVIGRTWSAGYSVPNIDDWSEVDYRAPKLRDALDKAIADFAPPLKED